MGGGRQTVSRRAIRAGAMLGGAGSAVTSAIASICCIGPLALTLLGVQGAIFAAAFKPYRWYILGASGALLVIAFWMTYQGGARRRGAACGVTAGRATRVVLWVSLAVWVAAAAVNLFVTEFWLKGGGAL